ncbi:hypothetical protein BJ912DRAFT_971434 [Pholiota molesta]|nr:hypothetical protein BJ912DRAFT_971434 [Pholiota molesta]
MGFSDGVKFDLDVSGIAGFFGGDESIAAMASVNLIRNRWLLGWYNSPGSYFVSKKYGMIAGTRVWDGLFPGNDSIPAEILGLDGKHGPRFLGAKSGTSIAVTGHLSHLLFSHCKESRSSGQYLYSLTLVSMHDTTSNLNGDSKDSAKMDDFIAQMSIPGFIGAFLTTGFSIAAALIAALVWQDYFCCISIGVGILCNGFATLIYGSATLMVHNHGILFRNNDIVILQGPESKIAGITRGRYELIFPGGPPYHRVGIVSIALAVQAFSQLILLPAATLNGQVIFLATFALSWFYNAYLASVDRENLQFKALKKMLGLGKSESFEKKAFLRWASVVAASTFHLRPIRPDDWIRQLIPNSTPIWDKWRAHIVHAIELEAQGKTPTFTLPTEGLEDWDEEDKERLMNQLHSAEIGYDWYQTQLNQDDDRKPQ